MASSRVGTPSLRKMAETWLRTVVGETKSRSEICVRRRALAHELQDVPLPPGEAGGLAIGHGDPALLAVAELVDEPGDERSREARLPGQYPLQRLSDAVLVEPLQQVARRAGAQRVEEVLVLP